MLRTMSDELPADEIVLRIESAGEPLVGWVSGGPGGPVRFSGWLELAAELTARLDAIAVSQSQAR